MPKMKTKKAVAKRFRTTGTGRIRRSRAFASHILTKKSRKRKRNLRRGACLGKEEARRIGKLLPYG